MPSDRSATICLKSAETLGIAPVSTAVIDLAAGHLQSLDELPDRHLGAVKPAHITPVLLLDPFIPNLATALRTHRKTAAPAARLRLRVAVHMGLLHHDGGWAGEPLVHCARLLDSAPLRRVLDTADNADMAVIVSQEVYDTVVRHGYGLDPDACHRATVQEKETTTTAWVHVPGRGTCPSLPVAGSPTRTLLDVSANRVDARHPLVRTFNRPAMTVSIRVGDLFDEDTHLVVGFSDTFDTSTADAQIVSNTTVQGQLLHRRYGGDHKRLDRELQSALARHTPVTVEKRDAKRRGKLTRFPIGTVAVLGRPGHHIFAVAYSHMGNDLVARTTVDDLWLSLSLVSIQVPVSFDAGLATEDAGFGGLAAQVGVVAGGIHGLPRIAVRSTAS